jgi:hypothetical protein
MHSQGISVPFEIDSNIIPWQVEISFLDSVRASFAEECPLHSHPTNPDNIDLRRKMHRETTRWNFRTCS